MIKRILFWLFILAVLAVLAWGLPDIVNGWAPQ